MRNILGLKWAAWGAFALILIWTVSLVVRPVPWWGYIAVFFAFMMTFCHLAALYLYKVSNAASRKLDLVALVMGCLFVIAILVEAIMS